MKHSFLLWTLIALSILSGCTKEGTTKLKDVDDVCTQMDDINFMKYCYDNFDVNHDGKVSMEEANAILTMNVDAQNIRSLKGIEYFPKLKELSCTSNKLTSLDVSGLTQLLLLDCEENYLSSLNVSKAVLLDVLSCEENSLETLDITQNTQLSFLACYKNKLSNLDVSKNTKLAYLDFSFNQVASIDLSNNSSLKELLCSYNNLRELDLATNTSLTTLACMENEISVLDLSSNSNLKSLLFKPQKNNLTIQIINLPPRFLPKQPTGLYLHSASKNSLSFQWDANPSVRYYYELYQNDSIVKKGYTENRNVILDGLTSNTAYRFSLTFVNGYGKSEPVWLDAHTL